MQSSGYGYGYTKRVTLTPPEPEIDEEQLAREREEAERAREEAEREAQREREVRVAKRRKLLAEVKKINTRIVVRKCAQHWKLVTVEARHAGPHGLPESEKAFHQLPCSALRTPKDTVVAFLLATFKYKKDRGTGERMLARTLHPELLSGNYTEDLDNMEVPDTPAPRSSLPPTPSKRKLRKSTRLRLQTLRSNTLAS